MFRESRCLVHEYGRAGHIGSSFTSTRAGRFSGRDRSSRQSSRRPARTNPSESSTETTMSSIDQGTGSRGPAFFSKAATVAGPGFTRWMVPPAALAVHLCIGQAYAFSVFNAPLTRVIGITQSAPDDWTLTTLGWIFSLAIVFLGLSAAFAGKWLEKVGPRRTMFTAACCFGGGFLVSALGVYLHQIVLLYLGYGVIGGFCLALGYVSPVAALIRLSSHR